jgi:hypothetical protein
MSVFGDEALDRIAAESAAADAGKDWILGLTLAFPQPRAYHLCRFWTERRATQFPAFPEAAHVGPRPQHDVLAVQPNQLGNPQTGLHGNQDKGSIAAPDPRGTIRNGEQCIDLFSGEELDRLSNVAFIGRRQDPLAMPSVRRLFQSHVSKERVNGSQPNVPRASAVFANALQLIEEKTNEGSIEVFDAKLGWAFVKPFFRKLQKQAEAVAVCRDGIRARLPLAKQTIGEEALKKGGKAGGNHAWPSR